MTQPSKAEVGITPDDNNDQRLPGSVNPAPTNSPSSDFAKAEPLYSQETTGVIGVPSIGGDYAMGGIQKTASVTGPTGLVETTASTENLSKKYKYPQVSQDIPKFGNPSNTFDDRN